MSELMSNVEVGSIPLGDTDLVIIRSSHELTTEAKVRIREAIRESNPAWRGSVLAMLPSQEINTLPQPVLLELYTALKRMFEEFDKWSEGFEKEEELCIRCGSELAKRPSGAQKRVKNRVEIARLRAELAKLQASLDASTALPAAPAAAT